MRHGFHRNITIALLLSILCLSACTSDPYDVNETMATTTPASESQNHSLPEPESSPLNTQSNNQDQNAEGLHYGVVTFTSYWGPTYANDTEWLTLDEENDRILILAKDIIELRPYNNENGDVTWADSDVRQWLNDVFFYGLPASLQQAVITTKVSTDPSEYGASGGEDTTDKVFLLSSEEADKYLNATSRLAGLDVPDSAIQAADSASGTGLNIKDVVAEHGGWPWWLRSPGAGQDDAAFVNYFGAVDTFGRAVDGWDDYGIRPALWLST